MEETSQPSTETASIESVAPATEATTVSDNGEAQSTTSYMDGKYDSVSALEGGYKELQSTFSRKTAEYNDSLKNYAQTTAPEAYELAEGIESTSEIEALMAFGKEKNMSNEMFNDLLSFDNTRRNERIEANRAAEMEALGKDADTRLTNVKDWVTANLGEESIETLSTMLSSAKSVELFEKLSKMSNGAGVAQVAQPKVAVDRDTIKAMRFEKDKYGARRMSSDPQFRAKVEGLEQQFIGQGGKF